MDRLADIDVGGAMGGGVLHTGDDEFAGLFGETAKGGAGGGCGAAGDAFKGVENGEGTGTGKGEGKAVADAVVRVGFKWSYGGWFV